jgi:hypothetical protein
LDRSELAIFLFDKEEGGSIRALGPSDGSSVEVLFDEIAKFLLLNL